MENGTNNSGGGGGEANMNTGREFESPMTIASGSSCSNKKSSCNTIHGGGKINDKRPSHQSSTFKKT
jgi:hypothetical protein